MLRQRPESVLAVEGCSIGILGIDEQSVHAPVLQHPPRTVDCVHEQQLPESLALDGTVHRQSPEPDARNFPRQSLGKIAWQILAHDLTGSQRVETEYARWVIVRDGDKGLRDTTFLVLLRRLAQPKVKRAASAFEPASIVVPT